MRVRPLNDAERERGAAWRVEGNGILQVDPGSGEQRSDTPYKLDAVFDGGQPTATVYEATTQGLIHQVVNGFNSTVFAYGQVSPTVQPRRRPPGNRTRYTRTAAGRPCCADSQAPTPLSSLSRVVATWHFAPPFSCACRPPRARRTP